MQVARRRMKFIRITLLPDDSCLEIVRDSQMRLQPHPHSTVLHKLHPDVHILIPFAGGNSRLLDVLLSAGAAYKAGTSASTRQVVSPDRSSQFA